MLVCSLNLTLFLVCKKQIRCQILADKSEEYVNLLIINKQNSNLFCIVIICTAIALWNKSTDVEDFHNSPLIKNT